MDVWGAQELDIDEIQIIAEINPNELGDSMKPLVEAIGSSKPKNEDIFNFTHSNQQLHEVSSSAIHFKQEPMTSALPLKSAQPPPKRSLFEYHHQSGSEEESQEDECTPEDEEEYDDEEISEAANFFEAEHGPVKWDLEKTPTTNVESLIDIYIDFQIQKIMSEYEQQQQREGQNAFI